MNLDAAAAAAFSVFTFKTLPMAFITPLIGTKLKQVFPLAITTFNRRTRTPASSAAIARFAMVVGYLLGTLGPLLGGAFFVATGAWTLPIAVFALTVFRCCWVLG